MRNLIYLGYFFLKTDYRNLLVSIRAVSNKRHGVLRVLIDMVGSSLRYGSSFVEYFNFRFYMKSPEERKQYATMGDIYRFHKAVNAKEKIHEVDDKIRFSHNFHEFCNRPKLYRKCDIVELRNYLESKVGDKVVWKDPTGSTGRGVYVLHVASNGDGVLVGSDKMDAFIDRAFRQNETIYLENYILQHQSIAAISPSGVNTIRIITLLEANGGVRILGATLRISVNSSLDNYSAGNLAAEVDTTTGILLTGGIRRSAACDDYHDRHPVTGAKIKGFQLPFWDEAIEMVKRAALIVPEVRSVGWDVAITENGPVLVEGNSQWAAGNWQIPAGRGKKALIAAYLN